MQAHNTIGLALLLTSGCTSTSNPAPAQAAATASLDEHSFANPHQVRVTHVALDLDLDFARSRAAGSVTLDLERRDPRADLVLDCQGLEIEAVRGSDGRAREFELGTERAGFGRPLQIALEPGDDSVTVHYHTHPDAQAMQWLA